MPRFQKTKNEKVPDGASGCLEAEIVVESLEQSRLAGKDRCELRKVFFSKTFFLVFVAIVDVVVAHLVVFVLTIINLVLVSLVLAVPIPL